MEVTVLLLGVFDCCFGPYGGGRSCREKASFRLDHPTRNIPVET